MAMGHSVSEQKRNNCKETKHAVKACRKRLYALTRKKNRKKVTT